MPILDVEIVLKPGEELHGKLASDIADRAAEIFASAPGRTWVKVRSLDGEFYAENQSTAEFYPVFVTVLKARRPPGADMRSEGKQLGEAIGELCARPAQNVHIVYLPDAAGRVAFGGVIVPGEEDEQT